MRQESHRVYWQQAAATGETNVNSKTSSAAIRISDAACAKDVTQLLRQTLSLPFPLNASERDADSLVLVGTLYGKAPLVRFEHEPNNESLLSAKPFHVVRSLLPHERPLVVRDKMLERLEERYGSMDKKTHQLQWFFVPGTEPSGNIPSVVDLDGYCTSLEENDHDDTDSEEESPSRKENGDVGKEQDKAAATPWWKIDACSTSRRLQPESSLPNIADRQVAREQRRLMQLSLCRSALDNHCVSGYLLKQFPRDVHVWRRVHVVLTDDHLWFVSRIYDDNHIARHGRVGLSRALLVEPEHSLQYRIPHVFEVLSSSGTSHVFRASTRSLQARWIACIRERLVQCEDNGSMEHAELIVEDETVARNKRSAQVALPEKFVQSVTVQSSKMRSVVRFGMAVVNYRERCRHIQAVLPAKTTVVAVSSSNNNRPTQPQDLLQQNQNGPSVSTDTSSPNKKQLLDPDTREMVRSAWDEAAALLTEATQIAFSLPGGVVQQHDGSQQRLTRSVETTCRHVDYIITGRFRPLNQHGVFASELNNHVTTRSDDPPPADLFDHLLAELQKLSSATSGDKAKEHMNGTSNGGIKRNNTRAS